MLFAKGITKFLADAAAKENATGLHANDGNVFKISKALNEFTNQAV
jgi:hypothetical protein